MAKRAVRLQFSEEELSAPKVAKAAKQASKAANKMDKAAAKLPKKKTITKKRVVDAKTGSVTTRLCFEEVDKKKPPSKLSHEVLNAPGTYFSSTAHRELRESDDGNAGAEAGDAAVQAGERSIQRLEAAHRSHQEKPYRRLDKAEAATDKANLRALNRDAERQNGPATNPYSKWQQKRAIKKEYAAAKKAGQSADTTVKASETTARAAQRVAEAGKKAAQFVAANKKVLLIIGGIAAFLLLFAAGLSSCSTLIQGLSSAIASSTYPSADEDMLAAEQQYCAMEGALQAQLDRYEANHDYNEYAFDLDAIGHDPYVLMSLVTAYMGDAWTQEEVQTLLNRIFALQYTLTEVVETQTRYDTELRTGLRRAWNPVDEVYEWVEYAYEEDVPYDYFICTVTLVNNDLSRLPAAMLTEDQLSVYAMYMQTLGNRPDLWEGSDSAAAYRQPFTDYDIPPEALEDAVFAAMIEEAEKYLGRPYVWGGSTPATSFDCSGFVCWVINNCGQGWNVGRTTAQGIFNHCTPVSPENARPGDIVFFQGTYDTYETVTHVGIYVGGGMMIHAGNPIQYTSIETVWWQEHFYAFGRIAH